MKIVFTAEHAGDLSAFHQLGELLVEGWALGKPKLSAGQLIELAHDAEVLVTSYDEVTDAVMAACPRLQVIACTRANPVNIDTQAAQARGIRVLYTPGRNADAAAELTLGLMLSLARHIPQSHAALKRGEFTQADNAAAATQQGLRRDVVWDVSPESPYEVFKGTELRNKTLGLVGYGNIGRRVARIARAFGMAVLVVDPFVAAEDINEPGLQKTTLEALFREADIVSLHLSSGPHSDGLVNAALLNSMKPGALLINTSRAAVVDEAALIDALRHGPLGGAALDVYHREPLWRDHPFVIEFDNVIITPHIAGATRESIAKHTAMIAAAFCSGAGPSSGAMGRHKSLGLFPVHYPGIRSHPGRHQRGHRRGDVTRCFHAESARQCGNKPAAVAVAAAGGIHRLDRPRRNMLRPAIAADKPGAVLAVFQNAGAHAERQEEAADGLRLRLSGEKGGFLQRRHEIIHRRQQGPQ